MPKKDENKPLFRMDDNGKMADGKNSLYCGYVGGTKIGQVTASNATEAKKKLLAIARSRLK